MSLDAKGAAALALHRFGLGPRAGSIAAIASDPRGALLEEIEKPGAGQITDSSMLLAAESHPALLVYLDNFRSVGPMSVAGLLNKTGLHENLGREILELHTLGVRTVYSQEDVYRFAKTITGWTLRPMQTDLERGNEFMFNPRLHEPGPQTILGKTYPEGAVEQGQAVLADIARHPATAAHVAFKLARHFSADEPAPSLVERLSKRFLDTDGDLK